jgi:hypothetical protein
VIVAELASCFTAAQLGLAPASLDDHAALSRVLGAVDEGRRPLRLLRRVKPQAAANLNSYRPQS